MLQLLNCVLLIVALYINWYRSVCSTAVTNTTSPVDNVVHRSSKNFAVGRKQTGQCKELDVVKHLQSLCLFTSRHFFIFGNFILWCFDTGGCATGEASDLEMSCCNNKYTLQGPSLIESNVDNSLILATSIAGCSSGSGKLTTAALNSSVQQ